MSSTKVDPSVTDNKLICRVCDDRATGYHFDSISCESCKAFFRRNANRESELKCTFGNNQCKISSVTRRVCAACRLRKCFAVGMKKENILTEEEKALRRAASLEKARKKHEMKEQNRHTYLNSPSQASSSDHSSPGTPSLHEAVQDLEGLTRKLQGGSPAQLGNFRTYRGGSRPGSRSGYTSGASTSSNDTNPDSSFNDMEDADPDPPPVNDPQITSSTSAYLEALFRKVQPQPALGPSFYGIFNSTLSRSMANDTSSAPPPHTISGHAAQTISQPNSTAISNSHSGSLLRTCSPQVAENAPTPGSLTSPYTKEAGLAGHPDLRTRDPASSSSSSYNHCENRIQGNHILNSTNISNMSPRYGPSARNDDGLTAGYAASGYTGGPLGNRPFPLADKKGHSPSLDASCNPTNLMQGHSTSCPSLNTTNNSNHLGGNGDRGRTKGMHPPGYGAPLPQIASSPHKTAYELSDDDDSPNSNRPGSAHSMPPPTTPPFPPTSPSSQFSNQSYDHNKPQIRNQADVIPPTSLNHLRNDSTAMVAAAMVGNMMTSKALAANSNIMDQMSNFIGGSSFDSGATGGGTMNWMGTGGAENYQSQEGNSDLRHPFESHDYQAPVTFHCHLSPDETALLAQLHEAHKLVEPLEPLALDPAKYSSAATLIDAINMVDYVVRGIIKMAKQLPTFTSLCQEDQMVLLKTGCMEMILLRSAMTLDLETDQWEATEELKEAYGGRIRYPLRLDFLKRVSAEVYHAHRKFVASFHSQWRKDVNIMVLLNAIVLFSSDRPNLVQANVVEQQRQAYIHLLRRYLETLCCCGDLPLSIDENTNNRPDPYAASSHILRTLLERLSHLRPLQEAHVQIIVASNPDDIGPLLSEMYANQ